MSLLLLWAAADLRVVSVAAYRPVLLVILAIIAGEQRPHLPAFAGGVVSFYYSGY